MALNPTRSILQQVRATLFAPLSRRSWWIYLLVNATLLPFLFDYLNLNGNVYSASQLVLGLNPYGNGSTVIAPLFIQPFDLVSYVAYLAAGFDPYVAVVGLKLLALGTTVLAAALLYRYLALRAPTAARSICAAFLFSPFLLFDNAIWVQPEAYAILFLILAVYLHAKEESAGGAGGWSVPLLMGLSLAIATMTFFFPVLLIPTFLIYAPSVRSALRRLIALVVVSLPIALAYLGYGLRSEVTEGLVHSGTVIFPYSAWSLFLTPGEFQPTYEYAAVGVALLAAFAIPLLFQRLGRELGTSLALVLAVAFATLPSGLNADAFVIAVPFVLLALAENWRGELRWIHGLAVQAFLAPIFAIALLVNGPSYVEGIYYWSYPYLFRAGSILGGSPEASIVLRILLLVYLLLFATTFYVLLGRPRITPGAARARGPPHTSPRRLVGRPDRALGRGAAVVAATLLLSVLLVRTPGGAAITAPAVPALFFNPEDPSTGASYLPAPSNYWYYPTNGTVGFAPSNIPTGLERNVSGEGFSLRSIVTIPGFGSVVGDDYPFLELGRYLAGVAVPLRIGPTTTLLTPTLLDNASPRVAPSSEWESTVTQPQIPIPEYLMGPNSSVDYLVNLTPLEGSAVLFLAQRATVAPGQDLLWHATIAGTTYESYLHEQRFSAGYLRDGVWHLIAVPAYLGLNSTFFAGLSIAPDGAFAAVLNNRSIALPGVAHGPASIVLGEYVSADYSFTGLESHLLVEPQAALTGPVLAFLETTSGRVLAETPANSGSVHSVSLSLTPTGAFSLSIDSSLPTGGLSAASVVLGRVTAATFSCYLHSNSLVVDPAPTAANFLSLTLLVTAFYPLALITAIAIPAGRATHRKFGPRGNRRSPVASSLSANSQPTDLEVESAAESRTEHRDRSR